MNPVKIENEFFIIESSSKFRDAIPQGLPFSLIDQSAVDIPEPLKTAFKVRSMFTKELSALDFWDVHRIVLKGDPFLHYFSMKFLLWEHTRLPKIELLDTQEGYLFNEVPVYNMRNFVKELSKTSLMRGNSGDECWRQINPWCRYCEDLDLSLGQSFGKSTNGLSVIVPTFNVPEVHLELLCKDIIDQLDLEDELILVDTNDANNCIDLNHLPEGKIRLVSFNSRNIAEIRNFGLSQAKNDLVAYVDSDDRISPTHLTAQKRFHQRFPSVDATGSWLQAFGAHDHIYEQWDGFDTLGIRFCLPPAGVLMWKRDSILNLGGFNESFSLGFEDYDLVARAIACGKLIIVRDAVTYRYQRGHVSLSQSWHTAQESDYRAKVFENVSHLCRHKQSKIMTYLANHSYFIRFMDCVDGKYVNAAMGERVSVGLISLARRVPMFRKAWHKLPAFLRYQILKLFR